MWKNAFSKIFSSLKHLTTSQHLTKQHSLWCSCWMGWQDVVLSEFLSKRVRLYLFWLAGIETRCSAENALETRKRKCNSQVVSCPFRVDRKQKILKWSQYEHCTTRANTVMQAIRMRDVTIILHHNRRHMFKFRPSVTCRGPITLSSEFNCRFEKKNLNWAHMLIVWNVF